MKPKGKRTEPGLLGFSAQNLRRMRQFFEAYSNPEKLSTPLRELPWSAHLHLLSRTRRRSCDPSGSGERRALSSMGTKGSFLFTRHVAPLWGGAMPSLRSFPALRGQAGVTPPRLDSPSSLTCALLLEFYTPTGKFGQPSQPPNTPASTFLQPPSPTPDNDSRRH